MTTIFEFFSYLWQYLANLALHYQIALAVAFALLLLLLFKPKPKPKRAKTKVLLNSAPEQAFYQQLESTIDTNKFAINCKVRLADAVNARNKKGFWKVAAKHVDYLIINKKTSEIALAIELDDASHKRADAIKRDKEKNTAFKMAGIKLVRVKQMKTNQYQDSVFKEINKSLKAYSRS